MRLLRSCMMAFSCFSRIPMPRMRWERESMSYMMCFFPVVGVAIWLLVGLWSFICPMLSLGSTVRAAGVTLIPLAVTGGFHLDGFADVVDALSSHAGPEGRRQILKDPHLGAFAVMGVTVYLLLYFSVATELTLDQTTVTLLGGTYCLTRCLSGIATVTFRKSPEGGMLADERSFASRRATLVALAAELVASVVAMVAASLPAAVCMLAVGLACLARTRRLALGQFGGMSGDLAGYFLQLAELSMLVCLVVVSKVVMLS